MSSAAFRSIVLKYADRMIAFCRSHSASEEDAEDAAQETFLRAYRALRNFRVGESFAAWLFAIAANRARTGWSRFFAERAKRERIEGQAVLSGISDSESDVLRRIESETMREAVRFLPSVYRIPVELYYFAELSVAETAAAMGAGEELVKSRLFRARKELRKTLERGATGKRTAE